MPKILFKTNVALSLNFQNDIKISSMLKDGSFKENWAIPKNAIFIPAIHEIMRDPKHFEKPDEFLPER